MSDIQKPDAADRPQEDRTASSEKGPRQHGIPNSATTPEIESTTSFLMEQLAALLAHDPGVRSGTQEAARKMRAAARCSRSILEIHRKCFRKSAVKRLRAELKWLAKSVGPLRHATVGDEQARVPAQQLPMLNMLNMLGLGFASVENEPGNAYENAYKSALAALESDRYFHLISELQSFCADPPAKVNPAAHHRVND